MGGKYLTREQILAAPDVGPPNPAELKVALRPLQRFARQMRELLTRVAARLNPEKEHPSLGDDVFLIYAAAKGYRAGNPGAVEEALGRVADRFRRPVDRRRWSRVGQELSRQAGLLNRTERAEMSLRVQSNLFDAVAGDPDSTSSALRGIGDHGRSQLGGKAALRQIRAGLNRLVTEDLLGPGWHRDDESLEQKPEAMPIVDRHPEILAAVAAGAESLTRREHEVMALQVNRGHGQTDADLGRLLGISESAFTATLSNARKKIQSFF